MEIKGLEVLFVEKRKEKLQGSCSRIQKPVVRLEIGFYSFFCWLRAEVSLWPEQMFLGKEKYLPG
jgi:hypothetical protein